MTYVVIYERTPTSFGAYVPDLPGCVAVGKTRGEVKRLIREAVALHIEAMKEDGQTVPAPSAWADTVEVA